MGRSGVDPGSSEIPPTSGSEGSKTDENWNKVLECRSKRWSFGSPSREMW